LGTLDHGSGVVLGQTQVDAKTDEIAAFTPLLERIDRAAPLTGARSPRARCTPRTATPAGCTNTAIGRPRTADAQVRHTTARYDAP
jgi:hypothetical protein